MFRHNFSEDSDYHTQRNNKLVPFSSCNTTSAIMAMKQAEIPFSVPSGTQEEDHLTSLLQSTEAYHEMRFRAPWAFNEDKAIYPPQQVHTMLEWGINQLAVAEVDVFSSSTSLQKIVYELVRGAGIVISGTFDLSDGRELSHIVSLAGLVTSQPNIKDVKSVLDVRLNSIDRYIIDDPFGDWCTNYTSHRGNDIEVPAAVFNQIFKKGGDTQNKFVHTIKMR